MAEVISSELENTEVQERKAWRLFERDKWNDAKEVFDQILQQDPSNEGALQGKTASLRKLGEFKDATSLLQQAIEKHPTSVGILCERAWLALDQKQYDAAITAFSMVLRIKKTDESLFMWQLSLLRRLQHLDEAEELLNEALCLFPASQSLRCERGWVHFYAGRLEEAADSFAEVLHRDPKHESATQGRIACLRLMGRYAEAAKLATRALGQCGTSAGIQSEIGWLYFEQGEYEDAADAFRIVLALTPSDPYAYINLAWSLIRQGGREALAKASKHCRDALILDSALPDAMGCLGIAAFKQGRIGDAEDLLLRSIATDPLKGHHADLGALYVQMGRYDDAERVLKDGLRIKPRDAGIHLETGNLYLQTERLREATAEFRQAAAIDPRHPDPPRALAVALMESGRLSEAEVLLRGTLRTLDESKRWRLHLTLGQLLTRIGEETADPSLFEEALKEVHSATRLKPQHPEPHFFAGIVRCKLGDYGGSLKCFQRCLKADKDRVEAEINAKRVRALIREDKARSKASTWAGVFVGTVAVMQLIVLWGARWIGSLDEKKEVVSETMLTILVPICLGVLVVSVLLPWLSKLKLTGLEAELSEPKPKEELASGPKGEIGFGNSSRTLGLAVI